MSLKEQYAEKNPDDCHTLFETAKKQVDSAGEVLEYVATFLVDKAGLNDQGHLEDDSNGRQQIKDMALLYLAECIVDAYQDRQAAEKKHWGK